VKSSPHGLKSGLGHIEKQHAHIFSTGDLQLLFLFFKHLMQEKGTEFFFGWAQHGFPILPSVFRSLSFFEAWEAGYEGYWNDWGASWSEWGGWQSRDRLLLCQCDMSVVRL